MQYKSLFLQEAKKKLAQLEKLIMKLEQKPADIQPLKQIAMSLHSLKSFATTMNFHHMATAVHQAEEVFVSYRETGDHFKSRDIDMIFVFLDALNKNLLAIQDTDREIDLTPATASMLRLVKQPHKTKKSLPKMNIEIQGTEDTYEPLSSSIDISTEELEAALKQINDIIAGNQQNIRLLHKKDYASTNLGLHNQTTKMSDLRQAMMQLKLVPVKQYFAFIPRLVRDLAREGTKFIQLEFEDNDLKFERQILESLREICIHIIRNAVDHAFQDNESGKVGILFESKNNEIHVTISDTGNGIDWHTLKVKAVKLGLLKATSKMNETNKYELLFKKILSTKSQSTTVSGRGVGLLTIYNKVRDLQGTISYMTRTTGAVRGTSFKVIIPVKQTMFRAVTWRWGNFYFALPMFTIESLIHLPSLSIKKTGNNYRYKKKKIPVVDIGEHLQLASQSVDFASLAIIKWQTKLLAVGLPSRIREQEIILESLPCLSSNSFITGVAVSQDSLPLTVLSHQYLYSLVYGKK